MENLNYTWPKIGNDNAISFLDKVISSGNPASTFLFVGPDNLGKSTIALSFARNLQKSLGIEDKEGSFDGDLHVLDLEEDKKTISIEAVREYIRTLSLSSFSNGFKIALIKNADYLSEESKSALLKTLEEPKEGVVIIMLARDLESFPATITSRAQVVRFQPVSAETIYDYLILNYNTKRTLAKDLANYSLGRPLSAIKLLEEEGLYEKYIDKAEKWLKVLEGDSVNARMAFLDEFFKDRTWSKEAVERAREILDMAESMERDLILVSLGNNNSLRYNALREKIENLVRNSDNIAVKSLNHLKLIAQARKYLKTNVNPRLVLEQIVINL
ncbi:MAG: AAA family ATPase [Patescibacteria group bacterium]|jgi:DNA polymerase-3 subunit delta'|nr:AAA family ATPase [Patescibacteria group bacterium]